MYVQNVTKYMGKLFYVFNQSNTLSNGMPIIIKSVQQIIIMVKFGWFKSLLIANAYYGHLTVYITSNNILWVKYDVN